MVKEIYLEKAVSKKTNNEYLSIVFDCGWTKVRLFADKVAISSIFDLSVQELSELGLNKPLLLPFGD